MTGTIICLYTDPEHYNTLDTIADRLTQMGIHGGVILYIHSDDPIPPSLPELFIIRRCTERLGYMTALHSALIDFPNANIIILHDSILYDNLRLALLLSQIDMHNYVMALKGYRLTKHQLEDIECIEQPFVFGSIPDLRHGCMITRGVLHANMIDIDMCKKEFKGCEHIYLAYLLMTHSIPIKYNTKYWRDYIERGVSDAKNDISRWSEIYNALDMDSIKRGAIKLSYMISSENIHNKFNYVIHNSINILPDVPIHEHPVFYISLTSFGKRNSNIKLMIQQLKKQIDYIYAINLWIVSDEYTETELSELRDICYGFIDIHIIENPPLKYKSYNKMIHQLTHPYYKQFNMLVIDDDILYPVNFIQKRLESARLCNYRLPCGSRGLEAHSYLRYKGHRVKHGGSISFNDILEGFGGVWYPSGIFSSLDMNVLSCPDIDRFGYADDIYISYLFRKLHIPTYYDLDYSLEERPLPYIDALRVVNTGESGNNMTAIQHFIQCTSSDIYILSIDDKRKCYSIKYILSAIQAIKDRDESAYIVVQLKYKDHSVLTKLNTRLSIDVGICTDLPVNVTKYIKA